MNPVLTDSQKWLMIAGLIISGWLIYLLAPVLSPFLTAGLLAYLGDPLVDRLENVKLSRTLAVVVVLGALLTIISVIPLLLIPLLEKQISVLISTLPTYLDWASQQWLRLEGGLGGHPFVNAQEIKSTLIANWQQAGGIAASIMAYVGRSGLAVLNWLANILLVPVVTFYMLRDWDHFIAGIHDLLPRSMEPGVSALAREADEVLGAFLRGQLMVMACLSTIYITGLWLAGLDFALLIGLLAGTVSFVPYLGVIVGILVSGLAMLFQTQEIVSLLPVIGVFAVGQLLEGMILTPLLVGDRIGLHPVTVIFAVLAGGQLFGFVGVLLALPVAAVLAVIVRRAHLSYKASMLYRPPCGSGNPLGKDGECPK
jgi:predicted PurR-regulated permease PerM